MIQVTYKRRSGEQLLTKLADGTLDLIGGAQNGFVELLGTGTGLFDAAVTYFVQLSLSSNAAVGDLNGDGRPDIVLMDQDVLGVFFNAGGTNRQATSIAIASSQNPVQALSGHTITASVTPFGSTLLVPAHHRVGIASKTIDCQA